MFLMSIMTRLNETKLINKIALTMKKNFIKTAFVAAFASIANYGVYTSQQKVKMSDLAMANVEA